MKYFGTSNKIAKHVEQLSVILDLFHLFSPYFNIYCYDKFIGLSLVFRERPFNLKGGAGGGYGFFLIKYSDSQCCWTKYSDFGGGKKISDSEFLSYDLMLDSGKKIRTLHDKKINILTLVLSERKFLNETKNHNPPPLQVKWSVP